MAPPKASVSGLIIAAAGCALFYPASRSGYVLFLLAFFVLAAGITVLQVAANPYVTVLGPPRTASSRLTLTQAFNSLGTALGPYLGGMLILSTAALDTSQSIALPATGQAAWRAREVATVQGPYLALAAALLVLALAFAAARLPQIAPATKGGSDGAAGLLGQRHLAWGTIAIFLYVGGEVSIGSVLVNFLGDPGVAALRADTAAKYVSLYWAGP
jgi:FHS family L-fucose permease-like MFS transporter